MPLTLYHLHFSQCDRLIWLCEELKLLDPSFTYEVVVYPRGLPSSEGKKKLFSLHPSGTSPTIHDTNVSPPVTLTESQACLEYILAVYGKGVFTKSLAQDGPQNYAEYLYWLSFASGSFQAWLTMNLTLTAFGGMHGIDIQEERKTNFLVEAHLSRTPNHLSQFNDRLAKSKYLASNDEISAPDFQNIYGLTTMRAFYDLDYTPYPNIVRYLRDLTSRPAYRKMLEVAEDGLPPLIEARVRQFPLEVVASFKPWTSMLSEEQQKDLKNATLEKTGDESDGSGLSVKDVDRLVKGDLQSK